MACFITRWFKRRQAFAKDMAPSVPAVKAPQNSIPIARLTTQKNEHVLLLGCLQEGSCTIAFEGIPKHHETNELETAVTQLAGFVSHKLTTVEDKINLVINFATMEDAIMALAAHPNIDLGDGNICTGRHIELEADAEGPARKKMKLEPTIPPVPKCHICDDELTTDVSKPCFYCKTTWCHECLAKQFTVALEDPEQFPAKCCNKVLHFDVVRGILSSADYTKYRERFEQYNTTKPVYCALPTCSTFLPPRVAKPNSRAQIDCPECQTTTCTKCRIVVDPRVKHECVLANETTALLVKFGYKTCPRCGTGVAKMFGCPHIRCQCGAHWCWECQRPIQICWARPCEANNDGDYYDEESVISEDESQTITEQAIPAETTPDNNTAQPEANEATVTVISSATAEPVALEDTNSTAAAAAAATQADVSTADNTPSAPILEETFENLDDEDAEEWEVGDYDFGDEPLDESWDTWGCMHRINPVINKNVWCAHRDWLPTIVETGRSAKKIDCHRCYKTITLVDPDTEIMDKHERKDSACDVSTIEPSTEKAEASITVEKKEDKKKRKSKKSPRPELYNCAKCGVFYCLPCNKTVIREIHNRKHSMFRLR